MAFSLTYNFYRIKKAFKIKDLKAFFCERHGTNFELFLAGFKAFSQYDCLIRIAVFALFSNNYIVYIAVKWRQDFKIVRYSITPARRSLATLNYPNKGRIFVTSGCKFRQISIRSGGI
jgi:hypothetical protein